MDGTLGASGNEEEEPCAGSTARSKQGLNEPLLLPKSPFFPHGISPWSAGAHEDSARGNEEGEGSACQQQVLVHPSGSRQQAGYWCVAERGGLAIWCGMVQRLDRQIEKGFRFRCLDRTSRYQNQPNLACFKTQEHVVTFEDLCLGRPAFFWLWSLWLECYQASAAPLNAVSNWPLLQSHHPPPASRFGIWA